ncbi:hypothetical protein MN202_18610 [Rheinheimera muenzenbergensis]|uniref:Uncharacterized protein n=1 Tax=Rheinheimera muenzenbergensis TaxID=1193628 RepID=A0ABU8CBA1_9GAMM|nr:hypothetical protein [Gammaproteobacteria bacterium]MBU1557294.1 hypothetical protein [Gammaproteobacteria bacterium]MBU2071245.1 hypothetical protein [Gammaproteobacteria bacterium]MBU2181652.1 hypothetical protein [Gammaproteobacteria bacterium]MBU2205360.1 hypothetical protein [Gammaproteobacteria bacterium]
MSKLDKDQVVADFTAAYTAAFGKAPQLEQKPGWFSVDGGKNIRLAELAELGASYASAKKPATAAKAEAAKSATKSTKAAKTPKSKGDGGKSASAVWAERTGAQRQPRGCR